MDTSINQPTTTGAISATEARVHFGKVLRRVTEEGETVFVERGGRLAAVVLSVAEYERLLAARETTDWRERAQRARALIKAESGGRDVPAAEDVIRAAREERDERFGDLR